MILAHCGHETAELWGFSTEPGTCQACHERRANELADDLSREDVYLILQGRDA
jgi:hypothetical protein